MVSGTVLQDTCILTRNDTLQSDNVSYNINDAISVVNCCTDVVLVTAW